MSVLPLLKLNHFPISVSGTVSMVRVSGGSTATSSARRIRAHGIAYILHIYYILRTGICMVNQCKQLYYLLEGEVGIGANAIAATVSGFVIVIVSVFVFFQFSASFCFLLVFCK